MSGLTNKLWFKAIAFIVLQMFFLTQADISWAANYRERKSTSESALNTQKLTDDRNKLSNDVLNSQMVLNQPAIPFISIEQGFSTLRPEHIGRIEATIQGLSMAGMDLTTILGTLKNSGFSMSESGFAAIKQGYSKHEIYKGLIDAGYDKTSVENLLGNILKTEDEKKQDGVDTENMKTGPPEEEFTEEPSLLDKDEVIEPASGITELPVVANITDVIDKTLHESAVMDQTMAFVKLMINAGKRGTELIHTLKKAGLSNEKIISSLAQLGFSLKDIIAVFKEAGISCKEIIQSINNARLVFSDKDIYDALLRNGFSDKDIVSGFKAAGLSAAKILKIATDLRRDMVKVAKAMLDSGFSYGDVAKSYVLKAMKWTWDHSINIVNCAVHAVDAFLSNIGRKFTSKEDLAYELIVDDILRTGEVEIQNDDVMTSMLAIKKVAQKYGIDMQGYNLTLQSLLELQGKAIVHLDGDHWVSIVSIDGENVTIIDNGQKKVISITELNIRWDGNTLALNQESTEYDNLVDLQMRQIRGGRGWNPFKAIAKIFKAVVDSFKTFFKGLYNAVVGSIQMLIGIVTLDWQRVKDGFWQSTMGTFQMLTAPNQVLYSVIGEKAARIVAMVIKAVVVAICTIIGGIIGTICGGQTQLGMALGAFVGTIISYTADYDMVMACKAGDMKSFKQICKRMLIEALINAAVAFCFAYAAPSASGAASIGKEVASAGIKEVGKTAVRAAIVKGIVGVATQKALQTLVINAAFNAAINTAVAYGVVVGLEKAGVSNPYVRALIAGAAAPMSVLFTLLLFEVRDKLNPISKKVK